MHPSLRGLTRTGRGTLAHRCAGAAVPGRDDLRHDRERGLRRLAAAQVEADGAAQAGQVVIGDPCRPKPLAPVRLRLAAADRTDVPAAPAERGDDGRLVELDVVGEDRDRVMGPQADVVGDLVPRIESALASPGEKAPYAQAAMFYLENNLDLQKALTWMDAAIAANPKAFYLVYRKALILEKMGDKAGAIATSEASLAEAEKATGAIKDEYIRLNKALLARLR